MVQRKKTITKPNEPVEVFMSLIKIFLLFVLLNNLVWYCVIHSLTSTNGAEITQMQDGTNNVQEMTNG